MPEASQYCLRWTNHHATVLGLLDTLYQRMKLCDTVLVAEGVCLNTHKLVLSACSNFFENLYANHKENNPVIILRDSSAQNVKCLLEFMYTGVVNVPTEELSNFLATANVLRIKGLMDAATIVKDKKEVKEMEAAYEAYLASSPPQFMNQRPAAIIIEKEDRNKPIKTTAIEIGNISFPFPTPVLNAALTMPSPITRGNPSQFESAFNGRQRKRLRNDSGGYTIEDVTDETTSLPSPLPNIPATITPITTSTASYTTKDVQKPKIIELPRDCLSHNLTTGVPCTLPRDGTRNLPRDLIRDLPRDLIRDLPRDLIRELPRDLIRELPRDFSRELPRDFSRELPRDFSRELPRDFSRELPRDLSREIPNDLPHNLTTAIHRDLPRDLPSDLYRDLPIKRDPYRDHINLTNEIHHMRQLQIREQLLKQQRHNFPLRDFPFDRNLSTNVVTSAATEMLRSSLLNSSPARKFPPPPLISPIGEAFSASLVKDLINAKRGFPLIDGRLPTVVLPPTHDFDTPLNLKSPTDRITPLTVDPSAIDSAIIDPVKLDPPMAEDSQSSQLESVSSEENEPPQDLSMSSKSIKGESSKDESRSSNDFNQSKDDKPPSPESEKVDIENKSSTPKISTSDNSDPGSDSPKNVSSTFSHGEETSDVNQTSDEDETNIHNDFVETAPVASTSKNKIEPPSPSPAFLWPFQQPEVQSNFRDEDYKIHDATSQGFWKNSILGPYIGTSLALSPSSHPGLSPPLNRLYGSTSPFCGTGTTSSQNWGQGSSPPHRLSVTSLIRSNECSRCGRLYKTRKGLKHHVKNECGVEPRFECTHCDWKFKQKAHLLRHMARKHTAS